MRSKDRLRLSLLQRALSEWSGAALGKAIPTTSLANHDMEREAFEGVSILLQMQSLGDTVWITAEFEGATIMMPFDVAEDDGFCDWMMDGKVNKTLTLSVN